MDLEKNIPSNIVIDSASSYVDPRDATRIPSSDTQSPHLNDGLVMGPMDPMDPGEAEVVNIRQGNSLLRSLRNFETWMDRKLSFEAMGVERIPENKRKPPQILNASTPSPLRVLLEGYQVTDMAAR